MNIRFHFLTASAVTLLAIMVTSAQGGETNDAPPAARTERKVFIFEGGRPIDFILAVDRHFRTRLEQILSIPSSLARARVPKMKIATETPAAPLTTYNSLHDPELGQWRWDGPPTDPSVLALVPDKEAAIKNGGARVRAMSLGGLPTNSWDRLLADVQTAHKMARETVNRSNEEECDGTVRIQPDSKILIVAGTESYIDMVESVITAHRKNAEVETGKPADSK